jgi:hypothetical protein
MALPNLWSLYNLRSSPFFQATLRADSQAMPLHLFVGRQRERQLLLTTIGSSASSLQPVNETVLLIDPARPATGEVFTQRFRLADARKGITQSGPPLGIQQATAELAISSALAECSDTCSAEW